MQVELWLARAAVREVVSSAPYTMLSKKRVEQHELEEIAEGLMAGLILLAPAPDGEEGCAGDRKEWFVAEGLNFLAQVGDGVEATVQELIENHPDGDDAPADDQIWDLIIEVQRFADWAKEADEKLYIRALEEEWEELRGAD